jgi:O-antigen/teichoic acid export membrane protein
MSWETVQEWFVNLGKQYGVNPIVFGSIYVGAIPFFSLSLAWLARNLRQKKSVVLPAVSAGFFFISAYLYLIIAGHNVPVWVYLFIAAMVLVGAFSTVRKVKTQVTGGSK